MAVSRPRSVPAYALRFGVVLSGAINGVNTTFTTPEDFRQTPPTAAVALYFNGQRLLLTDDFLVSESGGPGTGFDTITTLFAPVVGDRLWVDYFAL